VTSLLAGLKERAERLMLEVRALYHVARDPRTPWYAKLLVGGVVAYALSPIDLIPDFIPVIGYLDDLLIVPLGIWASVKLVPPEVMADGRALAARKETAMEIVEATDADLESVLAIERAAFGEDEVAELVRALLGDDSALPLLSLLAVEGDRQVGHILFTAAHVVGASREVSATILGPLAVMPDAQGRGVGRALIRRGLELLAEQGMELVFVLGYPEYYPRFGFEPSEPLGLSAPYPITPAEAWMVQALRPGVLGEVRGTIACAETMNRPEHWRE
jgi:putative acetyltransferase